MMQPGANLTYSYASEEDDDTAFGDAAITPAPAPSGTVDAIVEQLQESLFGARVQKAPSRSPRDAYISLDEWENGQHGVPLLSAGVEGGGIAVHVEALSYAIQARDRSRKLLLHDVSFEARPGEMVAVMGASGAGKSTLLDLIAGRKQEGFVAGTIAFNGEPLTNQIRRSSAYVEQNDVHLAAFTVRETLHFAAQLRLPESLSAQQRHARVGQIAAMLGLQECMDSVVGDALTRGISGGQMKRLSIGTEIIAVPPLLFLDEPTSGLDSAASLGIATSLRQLATAQHHTIMATIHQPSPEVFSQFDKVLLLSGGREVYFGPVADCHKYFSSLPLGFVMPPGMAPAEFIVAAAAGVEALLPPGKTTPFLPEELAAAYCNSAMACQMGITGKGLQNGGSSPSPTPDLELDSFRRAGAATSQQRSSSASRRPSSPHSSSPEIDETRVPWLYTEAVAWCEGIADGLFARGRTSVGLWTQLKAVMWRSWLSLMRDTDALAAMLLKNTLVGLLSAAIFWGAGRVKQSDWLIDPITRDLTPVASNVLALQYFAILYAMTGHMQAVAALFESKRNFQRERAAGLYCTAVYWLVQATVHLPLLIVTYTVYLNIAYWPMGLPANWNQYWYFFILLLVSTLLGYTTAQFFAALLPTPKLVFSAWPMFFIFFSQFSGFAVRVNNVIIGLRWLCYVSFVRWIFQGCVTNAFIGHFQREQLLDVYGFDQQGRLQCLLWVLLTWALFSLATLAALMPPRPRLKTVPVLDARSLAPAAAASSISSAQHTPASVRGLLVKRDEKGGGYYVLGDDDDDDEVVANAAGDLQGDLEAPLLSPPGGRSRSPGKGGAAEAAAARELFESAAPSEAGCSVFFQDLNYWVEGAGVAGGELHVLRGVGGAVDPGQTLCIMGPSGAGKTTLLDILAGRKSPQHGKTEGLIHFSNRSVTTAYVMQDNVHVPSLTVRETLEFAARLRVPSATRLSGSSGGAATTSAAALRERRVAGLLAVMGLTRVQHTRVGDEAHRGISGGEMKRLSIAVEIVNLPALVCCDEPTSGLDSATAADVMRAINNLAALNRTVITTIHQPSPEIFALFDRLLLLAGGKPVFFGPAAAAAAHFSRLGSAATLSSAATSPPSVASDTSSSLRALSPRAAANAAGTAAAAAINRGGGSAALSTVSAQKVASPPAAAAAAALPNPADAVMAAVARAQQASAAAEAGGYGGVELQLEDLVRACVDSPAWEELSQRAAALRREGGTGRGGGGGGALSRVYGRGVWAQCLVLTHRHLLKTFKSRRLWITSIIRNLFVGTFYGFLWWQLGPARIYERFSLLFFCLVFIMLGNQQAIPANFEDRLLFYRERGGRAYGTCAHWVATFAASVPLMLINTLVFSIPLYYMAGLNGAFDRFAYFVLVMALSNVVSLSFCQLLACTCRTEQVAIALFPILLFFFIAFGGFIVRVPTLPTYLKTWAPEVSFVRWALQGLVINEFKGNGDLFPIPPGVPITPEEVYRQLLDAYGFGGTGKWAAIPILLASFVVFRALTYAALRLISFERR